MQYVPVFVFLCSGRKCLLPDIFLCRKKECEYSLLNSAQAELMQRYVFSFLRQKQLFGTGFYCPLFSNKK
ncbi:hypothetical protein DS565_25620 [Salmonella enterica subsp. enterica serovar Bareilly]|nr:hypothetical protein [Salmonella enterica subsp. enterica serovar Bareilly]